MLYKLQDAPYVMLSLQRFAVAVSVVILLYEGQKEKTFSRWTCEVRSIWKHLNACVRCMCSLAKDTVFQFVLSHASCSGKFWMSCIGFSPSGRLKRSNANVSVQWCGTVVLICIIQFHWCFAIWRYRGFHERWMHWDLNLHLYWFVCTYFDIPVNIDMIWSVLWFLNVKYSPFTIASDFKLPQFSVGNLKNYFTHINRIIMGDCCCSQGLVLLLPPVTARLVFE